MFRQYAETPLSKLELDTNRGRRERRWERWSKEGESGDGDMLVFCLDVEKGKREKGRV